MFSLRSIIVTVIAITVTGAADVNRQNSRNPNGAGTVTRPYLSGWLKIICGAGVFNETNAQHSRRPVDTKSRGLSGILKHRSDDGLDVAGFEGRWTEIKKPDLPRGHETMSIVELFAHQIVDVHVTPDGDRFHFEASTVPYRVWNASAAVDAPIGLVEHNGMTNTIKFEGLHNRLILTTTREFRPETREKLTDSASNVTVDTFWLEKHGTVLCHDSYQRSDSTKSQKKTFRKYAKFGESKNKTALRNATEITVELRPGL